MNYRLIPEDIPNEGTLFVDHSLKNRSGHLSHALTEYKKGCVLALWSNCSGNRNRWAPGHNGFGWLEYATSVDMGDTWSEPKVLSYSWDSFLNEPFTVSCEKAVSPWENRIVLLCIRNENPNGWEPYLEPVVLISDDAGESWSEPKQLCPFKGRVYDAMMIDGDIYVLMLANDDFATSKPEHRYQIYVSRNGGESFQLLSELPGEYLHHAYGSMERLPDGRLICYTYNEQDEFNLDCWISRDMGLTWPERLNSFCKRRIRNPQVARVKGGYILHGRSGCVDASLPMQFVLYTSTDGIHWDDGTVLCDKRGNAAYYSNNLVMTRDDGTQRVLIQASVSYDKGKVNIDHWIMEFK